METICPLARPLLIALQVERTSFGFHVRECMRSSPPRRQTSGCLPKRELKAENGVDCKHKQWPKGGRFSFFLFAIMLAPVL